MGGACAASSRLQRDRDPDHEVKKVHDTIFVKCSEAFKDDDMCGYVRALLLQDIENDGVIPGLGRLPIRRHFLVRSRK